MVVREHLGPDPSRVALLGRHDRFRVPYPPVPFVSRSRGHLFEIGAVSSS